MANLLIWHQGKTIGPYTVNETNSYLASGHVSDQSPAWTEGLLDWSTVSEVLTALRVRPAGAEPPVFTDVSTRVIVPDGVRKFSWSAFFAAPVWAISNRVWVGLLVLIPGVGQLLQLLFGFHGRELAWRKGQWANVDQFNQVQKKRAKTSVLIWAGITVVFLALLVASGKLNAQQVNQAPPTQDAKKKSLNFPVSRQEFERAFKGRSIAEVRTVLGKPAYEQTNPQTGFIGYVYQGVTVQPGSNHTDDGTILVFKGGQLKEFNYAQEKNK